MAAVCGGACAILFALPRVHGGTLIMNLRLPYGVSGLRYSRAVFRAVSPRSRDKTVSLLGETSSAPRTATGKGWNDSAKKIFTPCLVDCVWGFTQILRSKCINTVIISGSSSSCSSSSHDRSSSIQRNLNLCTFILLCPNPLIRNNKIKTMHINISQ